MWSWCSLYCIYIRNRCIRNRINIDFWLWTRFLQKWKQISPLNLITLTQWHFVRKETIESVCLHWIWVMCISVQSQLHEVLIVSISFPLMHQTYLSMMLWFTTCAVLRWSSFRYLNNYNFATIPIIIRSIFWFHFLFRQANIMTIIWIQLIASIFGILMFLVDTSVPHKRLHLNTITAPSNQHHKPMQLAYRASYFAFRIAHVLCIFFPLISFHTRNYLTVLCFTQIQ